MEAEKLLKIKATAIENVGVGISICDAILPNSPIIYVNIGFSIITGYSSEEVIGKNCRFLQGPETSSHGIDRIRQALSEKKSIQLEIINYKKDGSIFWNKLSITPIYNDTGELTHFVGIQEDITNQKKKEALEVKVTNQLLINKTTLIAEEKQRREIGEELHDNVNQLLATIKLYLKMAVDQEESRIPLLKKSETILASAIDEIRKLSKSLIGPNMKETLEVAIRQLVQSISIGVPFSIEVTFDKNYEEKLTQTMKVMFYRVIQEQLNNIIKYAKPRSVVIQAFYQDGNICVSIKDDGIGFNLSETVEGVGLRNIKNRIEMENGSLSIITAKGRGCEMKVALPLILSSAPA